MKKLSCALAMFLALFLSCCVHLNINIPKEEKPSIDEEAALTKILNEVDYGREFKLHVFDCSNATAYLYKFLTERGYKCAIYMGWQFPWTWHAWLMVEKNGKKFLVESTRKMIVCEHYYDECKVIFHCSSLKAMRILAKTLGLPFGFYHEWDDS